MKKCSLNIHLKVSFILFYFILIIIKFINLTIEKVIMGIRGNYTKHRVIYYPKFHYELNHIEYFWCDGKSWTRRNCKYSIEGLREDIPKALAQVKGSTILGHYKSCLKKKWICIGKMYSMGQVSGKSSPLIRKPGQQMMTAKLYNTC